MARKAETKSEAEARLLAPLHLTRAFRARRRTVFEAWTSASHIMRWFSPEGYDVPDACIEARVGGPFELSMCSPSGEKHWIRGVFKEAKPFDRLVIDMRVTDGDGKPLFNCFTEVAFADSPEGTRMDLTQTYALLDPSVGWMVAGAPEGWRSTLQKLEKEVARLEKAAGEKPLRSVVHGSFRLERVYDASLAQVWSALTDENAKQKWFVGPGDWRLIERGMDLRVGGRERLKGRWANGAVTCFDAVYLDIVPEQRLIYAYEMFYDDNKLSVSLATLQLRPESDKTLLTVDEQGAFLDGYDDAGARERGTGLLLDALGASLKN